MFVDMQAETEKSENLFLYIDLPRFDFPVIFSEPVSGNYGAIRIALIFNPGCSKPTNVGSRSFYITYPSGALDILFLLRRFTFMVCYRPGNWSGESCRGQTSTACAESQE